MNKKKLHPDRSLDYFRAEWKVLALITVSGLIYNLGLMAGPWFEGKMAGCLMRILSGAERFPAMLRLASAYVIVIGLVQLARYIKRFYVRRFANNVNRRMKRILYRTLVHKSRVELEKEGAGNVITKAISDVDDCVEGMRKFTTEIFDTGVALLGYMGMLFYYDWRLALCLLIFPPFSYIIAEKMKRIVQRTGAAYKEQTGKLNAATLDRITNAITYRVFGCEKERGEDYEVHLKEYERAAVRANIWNAALPPVYKVIAMAGTVMILYFGSMSQHLRPSSRAIRSSPTSPRRRQNSSMRSTRHRCPGSGSIRIWSGLLRLRRRMRSRSRLKNSVQKQAKVIRNTVSFPQII